jgi:hypothetical protein
VKTIESDTNPIEMWSTSGAYFDKLSELDK